ILRTSFDVMSYSQPLQLVHKEIAAPLEVIDLRGRSQTEQAEAVKRWFDEEKQRGIAWDKVPLIRVCIHWKADERFQLTTSFHHAILDGWSFASLLTELFREYWYRLGREGGEIAEAPKTNYGEYIRLEREAIEDEECRTYWENVVKHIERKKSVGSNRGRRLKTERIEISGRAFEQLKELKINLEVR